MNTQSANYSLVSGGVIVLGISTSFTGVAPIKGAISPGSTSPATVSAFTTASRTAY